VLGFYQYYWLILFSLYIICIIIVCVVMFCFRNWLLNIFSGNSSELDQPERVEARQGAYKALSKMSRLIDLSKYSEHEECVICLEAFQDTDEVTPLPCDKRHYFHS